MTSSRRAALAVGISLAFLSVGSAPAVAQPRERTAQELETARDLYREGKELRAAGDLKGAIEKLKAAHALGNTPVTGIELARTYVLAGKLVDAREVALSIARMPIAGDETDRSAEARLEAPRLAEQVRPRIATLLVTGKGVRPVEVVHVTIDGAPVPDAAAREPLKVDPGKHDIVFQAGEGPTVREARASADLGEGQTVEVVVEVPPAPQAMMLEPSAPPQPLPPARPGMPTLAKVGFGVGIAGAAVGTFAGAAALILEGRLSSECPNQRCTAANGGSNDLNQAETWATTSTVSFAIGGAGLALALLELLGNRAQAQGSTGVRPWVGVSGAGVDGRF